MLVALLSVSWWPRRGTALLCALLLLFGSGARAQTSGNPLLAGYQADPEMDYFNGKYLADVSGIQGAASEYLLDGSTLTPGVYTVRLTTNVAGAF